MTNLWTACEKGNLEDIKKLIENGADVHQKNETGETALYIAVKSGRLNLVKYLVEQNANVNDFVNVKRQVFEIETSLCFAVSVRVLHVAIKTGSIGIVKILVENGADLDYVGDALGISYLHFAVADGSLEIVKYFVQIGAKVNSKHWLIGTPLHVAAIHGSLEIVQYLVEHNADVNYEHKWKGTALHAAAKRGSLEIAKCLIENGADVHHEQELKGTLLYVAAKYSLEILKYLLSHVDKASKRVAAFFLAVESGSLENVKPLVKQKGLLNFVTSENKLALHYAVERGSSETVKYLVEHGVDVNCKHKWKGTVLHVAVERGCLDIVKYLVRHGADVNYKHEWKGTALQVAVECSSLEIVKYLVEHDGELNYEHEFQGSALHVAVERGSLNIVEYLVQQDVDVNYENNWKGTALHVAAEYGLLEIVKYLVEHGADVNCKCMRKGTALHAAAERSSFEVVKCLVEHGSDVNSKNRRDQTPLGVAVNSGSLEIAKYLIERGAGTSKNKHLKYSLICLACEKGDQRFVDYLLQKGLVENIDKRSGFECSPLSMACSKGHTAVVRTLLKYNVDVRKEDALECGNDEIISILELELNNSVKHQDKVQILRSMDDENFSKVNPPLRYFAANPSLSLGVSRATVVYVGIMEDESEVAVKKMFTQSCSESAENERTILSLIDTKKSPFIVNYRHFFCDDTFMYLILDLCEETLRELVDSQSIKILRQHGPKMIKQILTGLEFLHELGILHRDLKPSNIFVDLDGRMRLADFGISRVLNEDETTDYTYPKGTTGWMAAEVIEAIKQKVVGRYKKKSDVQVVGMIAYFILTKGKHPYGDPLDRMGNIVKGKPVNLKKLENRTTRQFVSWLISHKLENRPYAHDALRHSFLDGIVAEAIEATLQRPQIIRI